MESIRRKLSPNPRETANILSRLFFTWTLPMFRKGYNKTLSMDDMYQPLNSDRSKSLGDRLERYAELRESVLLGSLLNLNEFLKFSRTWLEHKANSKESSLIWAVLRTFWKDFLLLSCLDGVNVLILRPGQALLLGLLLQYLQ